MVNGLQWVLGNGLQWVMGCNG